MSNRDKLIPADPSDLTAALAFALRPHGRKSHFADEPFAEILAKRLVEYLDRAGFVVMQKSAVGGRRELQRRDPEAG
jgi:hypothetical protein